MSSSAEDVDEVAETCDHHGDQVGVRIFDLREAETSTPCSWCGGDDVVVGVVKSERHELAFCEECHTLLTILIDGGEGST